jgi:hypothetical protein
MCKKIADMKFKPDTVQTTMDKEENYLLHVTLQISQCVLMQNLKMPQLQ